MSDPFEIRLLGSDDIGLVIGAEGLFDFDPLPDQAKDFLQSERDFLWFAMIGKRSVGFVSTSILSQPR